MERGILLRQLVNAKALEPTLLDDEGNYKDAEPSCEPSEQLLNRHMRQKWTTGWFNGLIQKVMKGPKYKQLTVEVIHEGDKGPRDFVPSQHPYGFNQDDPPGTWHLVKSA